MKFSRNQIDELVYADLFDSPLKIGQKYYCFPSRKKLIKLRKMREEYSRDKEIIAVEKTNILKKIPSVEAIFLTGSVAVGNAKKDADIDLMVVTSTNTLWITRLFVFTYLKLLRSLRSPKNYQNQICPNIFVDLNHLRVSDESIYTAHEILQAKPLFDRGGIYKKWLKENEWAKNYLPEIYKVKAKEILESPSMTPTVILAGVQNLLFPFEFLAFISQYLYMKPHMTNEKVGWGFAFFHPNDLSKTIPEKYKQRLLKYTDK